MNNDVTPPANDKPEADSESVPVTVNSSAPSGTPTDATPPVSPETPAPQPQASGDSAAPQVVTSENPTPADFGKKPRWGRRLVLAVVILALLGGAVWAAMQLNTPKKEAAAPAKKEITLIRVGTEEPISPSFYPNIEDNTLDVEINGQVFEGLTKFQDKTRMVPALATSWSNPDNNTWVFKLRQGVKFHNGHAFNAQAVKDCFEASRNIDFLGEFNDTIKSTEVVDTYTVKITTVSPDPLLLNKLALLWIWDTKGTQGDGSTGTGPYIQKSGTKIAQDSAKLVADNQYYGGKPLTHEIDFATFESDDTMLKALQANKLELGFLDDGTLASKAGTNYKRYTNEGLRVTLLVPNTLKSGSPLANKTVRQAVYLALNPQEFMKIRGIIGSPATQPVPPAVPGYDPTIKRSTTDVAKAKQLLTQAGYPNGFTLKLTYFKSAVDAATEAKKQLAQIGVTLTLDEQTDGPTLQDIAFGGKTDLYYVTFSSDLIDTSDVYNQLVYQQKNYSNTALDKLNDKQLSTLDTAKRLKLLQQMNDTFMADYGAFPLYDIPGNIFVASKNLHLEQQNLTSYAGLNFNEVYAE